MIPGSRCLFEAINYLLKLANIGWMILIKKARWLLYEQCFKEVSLKKCIVHVKLP